MEINTRLQDEAVSRDFIDNRSVNMMREAFGEDFITIDTGGCRVTDVKVVEEPTDYSEKIAEARMFLLSKGITEVKSVRNPKYVNHPQRDFYTPERVARRLAAA